MASTAKKAKYQCERCHQIFDRKERLMKHEETSEKHNCTYCDRKYCQLKDLRKHQLIEHGNVDWKKCDRCLQVFDREERLIQHQKMSEKYDCTLCESEYCQYKDFFLQMERHVQ